MTPAIRTRVLLLGGQTFSLGLLLSFILIAANALFLAEYGSKGLPYTYLGMAAVGVPTSFAMAQALRRWRLPAVAAVIVAAYDVVFIVSWFALRHGVAWVSGLLVVLFIVVLQMGLMLIGGQAGRLLDVRQIKEHFPRVLSGFAGGFLVGGIAAPFLLRLLGNATNLLLAATASGIALLVLVIVTGRVYRTELAMVDQPVGVVRPPLRTLLSKRFVMVILAYQVLSALGTQFVDFMFFDRAAARYPDADELARALGIYTALLNFVNIMFLAIVAGRLLRRFGLRLGISANPGVVAVLVAAVVAISVTGNLTGLVLLFMAGSARISDITLTDGMTRTSINATYQVLPEADRLAVQATVEGVGVPLALGLSGVVLLLVDWAGAGFTFVAVLTLVVCVVWTASGLALYTGYAERLVVALRQRRIDPTVVDVDDTTLGAIDELLAGDGLADIGVGLETLARAGHPGLAPRLATLTTDRRPAVRAEALRRMADLDSVDDLTPARRALRDDDAEVRAAAVGVVGRHGSGDDAAQAIDAVGALLDDPQTSVRAAALRAAGSLADPTLLPAVLRRLDDPSTASAAVDALARFGAALCEPLAVALAASAEPEPRLLRLIRAGGASGDPAVLDVLAQHLRHPQRDVQLAVLLAVGQLRGQGAEPAADSAADAAGVALRDAAVHATRCLGAIVALDGIDAAPLRRALRDEVDLAERIVVAALCIRYDRAAVTRAAHLVHGTGPSAALALEMLDVTVSSDDHDAVLPLLQPGLDDAARHAALASRLDVPPTPPLRDLIADLVLDPAAVWRRPWIGVCAAHAIATCGMEDHLDTLRTAAASDDPELATTARWSLAHLAPRPA